MGLTHTKPRNRLGWPKTFHHTHRSAHSCIATDPPGSAPGGGSRRQRTAQQRLKSPSEQINHLMDLEALTADTEFHLTVNEWIADIDAEEMQAAGLNLTAYIHSQAVVKRL